MIRVDPADWGSECGPVRPAPNLRGGSPGDRSRGGPAIPAAEIETLLRTISKALALGAGGEEGAGYRMLRDGRARAEAFDRIEHPWAATLVMHWGRIQEEYLTRHPGADLTR